VTDPDTPASERDEFLSKINGSMCSEYAAKGWDARDAEVERLKESKRKIADVADELKQDSDELEAEVKRLRAALELITGQVGIPNAGDACRAVLATARTALKGPAHE
jgi:FtsZ-binding cell division protein ZapB